MAQKKSGAAWKLLVLLGILEIICFTVAFRLARADILALRFMRSAPHATLSEPRTGPAVYAGVGEGPTGLSLHGRPAAAYWWRVKADDTGKRLCFESHVEGAQLRDDQGRTAPLSMLANNSAVAVLGKGVDSDWDRSTFADVAD